MKGYGFGQRAISTNITLGKVIELLDEFLLIFLNIGENNESSSFAWSCNFLMISTSLEEEEEEEEMLSGEFTKVDEGRVTAVSAAEGR